jgi:hypothetical protein
MATPIGQFFGCACQPAVCETKVVVANILAVSTAPASGAWQNSYCPGVYTVDAEGNAHTTCGAVDNIVNWLNSLPFTNNSDYPWDTLTNASFQLSGDGTIPSSPTGVTQTGAGAADDSEGSGYEAEGGLVATLGTLAGNICASAQIVAMQMTGNLFITGVNIPGVTQPCLDQGSGGCLSQGIYYIPMPPLDICSTADSDAGFQYAYALSQSANTEGCLPSYTGGPGSYSICQSPDPFFGSDPP